MTQLDRIEEKLDRLLKLLELLEQPWMKVNIDNWDYYPKAPHEQIDEYTWPQHETSSSP